MERIIPSCLFIPASFHSGFGLLCYCSISTVGNCTLSMKWVILFCQRPTQMLRGRGWGVGKTSLHCLWPWPELGRVWKQLQAYKANPLMWPTWKDRGLSKWHRLAPQPTLVTQTRLNWTNAWERFWRSPTGLARLPSIPCATWHACCDRESLGGSLASIQIPEYLPRASVCWGLLTVNPGPETALLEDM